MMNTRPINVSKALKKFDKLTKKTVTSSQVETFKQYANLQATWNKTILEKTIPYFPLTKNRIVGIGSFQGILEMTLASYYKEVLCVDFESYLPEWAPKNIEFHQADIDSSKWKLPQDKMFDVSFCIEVIEHLLWSPIPLLKWMKKHSHIAVISTPDDKEWPAMKKNPWVHYGHFSTIPSAPRGAKGNPEPMNHCKQYTESEFIELLEYVGFRLIGFFRTGEGNHQMVAVVAPRI
jgi:2-polyprenyl-3-methyl-5-hydroxy-6-metoxy-1,4-benzoquinol methylase